MKKFLFVILSIFIFLLSACGNKIPDLSYFEGKTSEDVSNSLIGNNIDNVINSWGESNENWETEKNKEFPDEYGYLWICNDGSTEVILYTDSTGNIISTAICKDVTRKNMNEIIGSLN